ncbi:MAG: hypothetical protein QW578_05710 [Thermoplasmatales archaeon]
MYENLPILKENYYVAFQVGTVSSPKLIVRQIVKKEIIPFVYDVLTENGVPESQAMLSPVGTTVQPFQPFYYDLNQLQLSSIQNIQDLFAIPNSTDIYQVFTGIAPSYVRFVYKQPTNTKLGIMSQKTIVDSTSFYNIGFDGFQSPFDNPSPDTEIFAIPGVSFSMILINTASIPVSPTIKFIINRATTKPVVDAAIISGIASGKIPAKIVTIGSLSESVEVLPAFAGGGV